MNSNGIGVVFEAGSFSSPISLQIVPISPVLCPLRGAIYNNGTFNINNSLFENNTATNTGGAIYTKGADNLIQGSTFTNNLADGGGAIRNWCNLTISDSTFTANTGRNQGGAILNSNATIKIIGSTFTDNIANGGGVIYQDKEGNISLHDSTFINNTARSGGVIVNINGTFTIIRSDFTANNARNNGGVIFNNDYNNITISDSTFTGNTARDGGVISNNIWSNLTITNSTFTGNNASNNGGVIFNNVWSNLNIIDSSFTNNTAVRGGAIDNNNRPRYSDDPHSPIIITDSIFTGNNATSGGSIYNEGNLSIFDSTFASNNASNGSVIYNEEGNLSISQSIISNNSGNFSINNRDGVVVADANWWGNDTPVFMDLVNFEVNNYYIFLLKASANITYPNEVLTITLTPVLNSTNESNWTGPQITIGDVLFNSTGTINKKDNYVASFSAANVGTYTITATSQAITPQTIIVTVGKASEASLITVTVPGSVVYGNYFTIKVTLKSRGKLLVGQKVYVLYKGKTYKTGTTNTQGIATIKMPKLKIGTYTFTIKYNGNNNYQASNKITKKVKIVPLKITVTTPRNGQKGYSQTRTIIITFNQKIKKSTKYTKIYIKNLRTNRYTTLTKKIIGNKLYIKMKAKRYKRNYYRIYIPRYAIVNMYGKTISKARTIKFRT